MFERHLLVPLPDISVFRFHKIPLFAVPTATPLEEPIQKLADVVIDAILNNRHISSAGYSEN